MAADKSPFSGKLRIRVCGLLVEANSILLTQIHSPITGALIWIPPGGGLEYGETMVACLKREFMEETDLQIEVGNLLHINELIDLPFHALEYYFEVKRISGKPILGEDPELQDNQQLLQDLRWINLEKLSEIQFVPVPAGLLEKLQDWRNRFSYPVLSESKG